MNVVQNYCQAGEFRREDIKNCLNLQMIGRDRQVIDICMDVFDRSKVSLK